MICKDCGANVEKILISEGICDSCLRRKKYMKEKYIPLKTLPEKELNKILSQRKYAKNHINKVKERRNLKNTLENEDNNDIIGIDLKTEKEQILEVNMDDLEKELLDNITQAFEKSNLDDEILIKNNYNELEIILKAIESINYNTLSQEDYETKREVIRKKVDVLDKYIIDILHNLEIIDINDTEKQIIEVKKLARLRKIRREFKNRYELLRYLHTFSDLMKKEDNGIKFSKTCKSGEMFLNSIKYKIYNKVVENPESKKAEKKLLNLRTYEITCDVVSSQTNRKIIKYLKFVEASSKDEAIEIAKDLIKQQYGNDSIWSKMKVVG